MFKQLHDESRPSEAKLNLGELDIVDVVVTITLMADKSQLKFASGSIFGLIKVEPH